MGFKLQRCQDKIMQNLLEQGMPDRQTDPQPEHQRLKPLCLQIHTLLMCP